MKRLVVIDGNAILHRAYHALPPLTAPDGAPVNAVYGFVSVLIKLFSDLKPTHMAVAFDRPKPTFRKALYKDYQATRPKMDDALVLQITKVHDAISSFGIPIYEVDGYEADDVIGTLTAKAKREGFDQVIIVTGDRDILQLVEDEKVYVFMPVKGLSEGKLYGEKEVSERMGVTPKRIPDLKALAGDPSDNYPGVSGIGPKTASSLITACGSVEALYKALERGTLEASDGTTRKLEEGRESAILSKDLATIRTDAPVTVSLEDALITTLNTESGREMLEQLKFYSLLKRLTPDEAPKKTSNPGGKKQAPGKKEEVTSDSDQLSLV